MNIINKLLVFDLLKNKQYQCSNLFDILSVLIEHNLSQGLYDSIKKFVRDVRKKGILEEN